MSEPCIPDVNEWNNYLPFIQRMAGKAAFKYQIPFEDLMHEALWVWFDATRKYDPSKGPFINYLSRALHNQFLYYHDKTNKHWKHGVYVASLDSAMEDAGDAVLAHSAFDPNDEYDAPMRERNDVLKSLSREAKKVISIGVSCMSELKTMTKEDLRSVLIGYNISGSYVDALFKEIEDAVRARS